MRLTKTQAGRIIALVNEHLTSRENTPEYWFKSIIRFRREPNGSGRWFFYQSRMHAEWLYWSRDLGELIDALYGAKK